MIIAENKYSRIVQPCYIIPGIIFNVYNLDYIVYKVLKCFKDIIMDIYY